MQVVTDNRSLYKRGMEEMMKIEIKATTSSATNWLDLFKDIKESRNVKAMVEEGQAISKFVYNHNWVQHL